MIKKNTLEILNLGHNWTKKYFETYLLITHNFKSSLR